MFNSILDRILQADVALLYMSNILARNPVFDFLMPLFDKNSNWAAPIVLIAIGVLIWGGRRGRIVVGGAVLVVILTDQISSSFIKPLAGRIRPCNMLEGLHLWYQGGWILTPDPVIEIYKASYSMPSSHATNIAGQAFWWSWAYPNARWWAVSFALLVGFSRVYEGVHWPSDVVAGWSLGVVCGVLLMLAARKWALTRIE